MLGKQLDNTVTEQSAHGAISPEKDVKLFFPKLAGRTGFSTDTVGRTVKALARTGAHTYQAVREIQEGHPVTRSFITIASNPDAYAHAFSTPAPEKIAPDGRMLKHGGARVCKKCGGPNLVPALLCRDCGHAEEEHTVEQKIATRHRLARGRYGPNMVPRPLPHLAEMRDDSADIHPIGSAVIDRALANDQDPDDGAPIAWPQDAAMNRHRTMPSPGRILLALSLNGEGPHLAARRESREDELPPPDTSTALWDALAEHGTPPRQTNAPGRRCCHDSGCRLPVKTCPGRDGRPALICDAGPDQALLAHRVSERISASVTA